MKKSTIIMNIIPAKNAMFAGPKPFSAMDEANNSANEMYIITPAENPKLKQRWLFFGFLTKKDIKLPIPVDRPATKLKITAKRKFDNAI